MVTTHKLIVLMLLGASLSGCQTPRYKQFGGVKQGMEKDLVLDEAGGPNVSRRSHGQDRWIYNYATPEGPLTREVHFEEGRAVYVGQKVVPAVSGEEQDRINDQVNTEQDKRAAAEHQSWADEHGVAYRYKPKSEMDTIDLRLQNSMYGTRDLRREREMVAPNYQEIK